MAFKSFLVAAIVLVLMQISVFGVYRVKNSSFEPLLRPGQVIFVNKLAFGLQIPFVSGSVIEWNTPMNNDLIVIQTKKKKKLLKRVFGVSNDVLINEGRRFIVPPESLFVGTGNVSSRTRSGVQGFGFVPTKNNCGKIFY